MIFFFYVDFFFCVNRPHCFLTAAAQQGNSKVCRYIKLV